MSKRMTLLPLPWYILLLIVLLCAAIFISTREGFSTNAANFKNDIKDKPKFLALFYSNTCGYCKDLKPEWDSASSELPDTVMTSVDCSPSASGQIDPEVEKAMKAYGVTGFPTMLFFNNGLVQEPYEGGRNAKDIIEYVKNKTASTDDTNNSKPSVPSLSGSNSSLF